MSKLSDIKYAAGYKMVSEPVEKKSMGGWGERAPGQNEEGYGSKITTDWVVMFPGSSRKYRVYATCWSNAASHWILKDRQKLHLNE